MTTERLSGLALMSIHYENPVDYNAEVQRFAEQQPRKTQKHNKRDFVRAHSQYKYVIIISVLFSRFVLMIVNI